jgi:hypothetical protein
VTAHIAQSAPPVALLSTQGRPASSQETLFYIRFQTVTLHSPDSFSIYTSTLTTTFQIYIESYPLGGWIRLPADAITREAYCLEHPTCEVLWGEIAGSPVVTYAGVGTATIYLEYNTKSRAWRDPTSRIVNLSYPVGPFDPEKKFSIDNTIIFSRAVQPVWEPAFVTPTGYLYDEWNHTLRWVFSRTSRLEFTANLTEPLLGSDLVIEQLEIGNDQPDYGELVRYTVTVRNIGPYPAGRGLLAELFVRPADLGPPIVLTDHVGGWSWYDPERGTDIGYGLDALFKWYSGTEATTSYWTPGGFAPGETVTGTTVLTWPGLFDECLTEDCMVWAKIDPAYLEVGLVYEWWGYNPEGLDCALDQSLQPTCEEEKNNLASALHVIYIPLAMRNHN